MLIEEVQSRNAIWNLTHDDHKNRTILNTLYGQIASSMTKSDRTITGNFRIYIFSFLRCLVQDVKDNWKSLRDYFNKCKKAQKDSTGLAEDDASKKWAYFGQIAAFMVTVPAFDGEE